jgi:glycosyltransferase involved in cell wall biosynthesis
MKKITILALHLGYGGIENCISNLANSLVDDYEVNIVSTYKLYEKPVFKLNDKIKIKYLMTDLKPNKQELKQSLKKLKLITFFKELKKSLKILKLKKNLMIEAIKNCDSDVIISTRDIHNNWLSKYGRDKTLKIGWEHNHHHNNKRYINKVTKSVLGLDYFVLVSKDLTKFYSEKLKDKKVKCVYIPNSINFFPQEKAKLETENLISIGRLSHEKGYLDLIDIFKELHQKYPDSKLNIIGDGPDRKKIEKKIRDNKLEDYIILHGFQEKEYINKYLEKSSVYIMTSYTESFGLVLLEAFAYGIPCVAYSSAEGANEIISDNWDGYLIKDRDKNKMIKRICELLSNRNRRLIMGANGIKKAQEFNTQKTKQKWIEIINRRK